MGVAQAQPFCGEQHAAACDLQRLGVTTFFTKPGHRQLELLLGPLAATPTNHRPGGEHVVERSEVEATAGIEKEAEVLGMAIKGAQHPEQHLRLEEGGQIAALGGLGQQLGNGHHAGTAIVFVFVGGWSGGGLATIFGGQAQPIGATGVQATVEALHDQAGFAVETCHLRRGHRQPKGLEHLAAEPLVLYRGAEINLALADHTHRQL